MRFGVGIDPTDTYTNTIMLAKLAEEKGYDQIWICDERFHREVFSTISLCAVNTETVKIGTAVTDPYIRHPAMTALAIATVDEMSNGRLVLGLGAGISGFHELNIKREKPALAMREAVHIIRELFHGNKVFFDGRIFSVNGAQLAFKPRSGIPIYVAGRGPLVLKLAGEVAEGAMIGAFASEESLHYAFGQIEQGLAKSGRTFDDLDVVSWVYGSISDDGETAKETVRPFIMYMILSSWPGLKKAGVKAEIAEPIIEAVKKLREKGDLGYFSDESIQLASELVPDEYIDKFSITGTPDECIKKAEELSRLGINQIAILPFPLPGEDRRAVFNKFAEKVVPHFRDL